MKYHIIDIMKIQIYILIITNIIASQMHVRMGQLIPNAKGLG